jgi:iron complex outermembrane receptor protein
MSKFIPIACLALLGTAGYAAAASSDASQDSPQATPATTNQPDQKIQQVTVSGTRADDTETRRLSTASKMVFGREELDRNGDTSISEVLKRLPGVSIGGAPGRARGGVRMRGPVAEHSTQAIAGTINIILREGYQQKDVQLRVANNLDARVYDSARGVDTGALTQSAATATRTCTTLGIRYEMKI